VSRMEVGRPRSMFSTEVGRLGSTGISRTEVMVSIIEVGRLGSAGISKTEVTVSRMEVGRLGSTKSSNTEVTVSKIEVGRLGTSVSSEVTASRTGVGRLRSIEISSKEVGRAIDAEMSSMLVGESNTDVKGSKISVGSGNDTGMLRAEVGLLRTGPTIGIEGNFTNCRRAKPIPAVAVTVTVRSGYRDAHRSIAGWKPARPRNALAGAFEHVGSMETPRSTAAGSA